MSQVCLKNHLFKGQSFSRDFSSKKRHNPYLNLEFYSQYSLLHSCDIAGSGLRPLSKIPHCCRSKTFGPCLSPNVADHPLRSAKHHRLCEPLSHQLPNASWAHLTTENKIRIFYFFLAFIIKLIIYSVFT